MSKTESEDPNQIALRVIGAPAQAVDLFTVEKSDGTEVFSIDKDGNIVSESATISSPSFIVYRSAVAMWKAYNCVTGVVDFSGTNGQTVLEAAIAALPFAGGTIYLKRAVTALETYTLPGRWVSPVDFTFASTVEVPDGVSVISDGAVIKATTLDDAVFDLNTDDEPYNLHGYMMVMQGLAIIGGRAVTPNQIAIKCSGWSRGPQIRDVRIYECTNGIQFNGPVYNALIESCVLDGGYCGAGGYGISLQTHDAVVPNANHISHCDISSYAIGADLQSGGGNTVDNCYLEGNTLGIHGDAKGTISGCFIQAGAGQTCVQTGSMGLNGNCFEATGVGSIAVDVLNTRAPVISGNNFYTYNGGKAITCSAGYASSPITGNTIFMGGGVAVTQGINGDFRRSTITGNKFIFGDAGNTGVPAVDIAGDRIVFVGNTWAETCGGTCLRYTAADDNVIVGNRFGGVLDIHGVSGDNVVITGNLVTTITIDAGTARIHGNAGYVTENSGTAMGTGAQQEIHHGLSVTPNRVILSEYLTGAAIPYQSAAADGTHIYVLATINKDFLWEAKTV